MVYTLMWPLWPVASGHCAWCLATLLGPGIRQNHASTIERYPSLPELMAAVYDRSPMSEAPSDLFAGSCEQVSALAPMHTSEVLLCSEPRPSLPFVPGVANGSLAKSEDASSLQCAMGDTAQWLQYIDVNCYSCMDGANIYLARPAAVRQSVPPDSELAPHKADRMGASIDVR
jgi:hypothetical protein